MNDWKRQLTYNNFTKFGDSNFDANTKSNKKR